MTQVPKAPLDARRQEIVNKAKATREANRLKKEAPLAQITFNSSENARIVPVPDMEFEYREMWAAAYASAIISCQVNHPTQTVKAAIIADKALEDFKVKFAK